jgi:hypothetical protein
MNERTPLTQGQSAALASLLGLGAAVPMLLQGAAFAWLPDWLGAAIAVLSVLGVLALFWNAGALRVRYIALFVLALALAAGVGAAV